MTSSLDSLVFTRADQPAPTGDPRQDLLAWLGYQRHEFLRKLRDLAEVQRADAAIAALDTYDAVGLGHGRPLGYALIKVLHEYTRT